MQTQIQGKHPPQLVAPPPHAFLIWKFWRGPCPSPRLDHQPLPPRNLTCDMCDIKPEISPHCSAQRQSPEEAIFSFQPLTTVCSAVWFLSNSLSSVRPPYLPKKVLFCLPEVVSVTCNQSMLVDTNVWGRL